MSNKSIKKAEALAKKKAEMETAIAQERVEKEATITFTTEGDKICAVFGDFVNLQESLSGFGDTEDEAKQDLMRIYDESIASQDDNNGGDQEDSDGDSNDSDTIMVTLKNVTNRMFNRIAFNDIISVKKEDVQYYLDNGFNYFGEQEFDPEVEGNSETEVSIPTVGANADDADNILNNL